MKLPFKLPLGKKENKEYFLSLVIRDEKICAVIFEELSGKVRIVSEQEEYFKDSIESSSMEDWLEVFDRTISKAEDKLPHVLETPKTIFGIKESWVEDSKIKKEYLAKLKKISDTLGLKPIGFIVIPEAIAHLLSKEGGAPVSAILVEIGKKNILISLIRAGKIIEIKEAPIEESIAHTTDTLLRHFTEYEVLPSRIILFDGEREDLIQEFIGHSWSKSLPFLHVPQIQALPKRFDARAVLFGAAIQMGFEILQEDKELKDKKLDIEKEIEIEEKITKEKETETLEDEKKDVSSSENFGFLKDVDVSKKHSKEAKEQITEEKTIPEPEIEEVKPIHHTKHSKKNNFLSFALNFVKEGLKTFKSVFVSILKFLPSTPLKSIRFPKISFFSKGKKIFFIPPLIIAFFIVLFLLYIFNVKATVTLTFNPKVIEENKDIQFLISDSSDFSQGIISSEVVSVVETDSSTTEATGTKEIGEKAKGTVTIYNSDLKSGKNIPKESIITSSNNLDFTLDTAVNLASASGDASSISPSTQKASVTATKIGKEYNLPSSTKFTVESFDTSTVIGKNETAFSGGSKKEVTVVSKKDRETLLAKISNDLSEKAKDEILKKVPSDKAILPIKLESDIEKTEFDQDIGEEAKSVSLKATITYEGIVYKKNDLEKFSQNLLKDKFRSMVIAKNGITPSLTDIERKNDDEVNATVNVKAMLLPEINKQNIAKQITGNSFEDAKITLSKLPQIANSEVTLNPSIPFLPQMLPRFTKNITIVVNPNE